MDVARRLEVTLQRTPIRRRLLVPDDFALSHLHVLVQVATGWQERPPAPVHAPGRGREPPFHAGGPARGLGV